MAFRRVFMVPGLRFILIMLVCYLGVQGGPYVPGVRRNSADCYGLIRILKEIQRPNISRYEIREFMGTAAVYESVRVMREIMACPAFDRNDNFSTALIASASSCNATVTEFLLENIPNLRSPVSWSLIKSTSKQCGSDYRVDFLNRMITTYGTTTV